MKALLQLITRFDGRINRAQFWLGTVLVIVPMIALSIILALLIGNVSSGTGYRIANGIVTNINVQKWTLSGPALLLLELIAAYPAAAIGVKRRHDRAFSGVDVIGFILALLALHLLGLFGMRFWVFEIVLCVWGVCLFILLGALKGTTGPNRYGPDTLLAPRALTPTA